MAPNLRFLVLLSTVVQHSSHLLLSSYNPILLPIYTQTICALTSTHITIHAYFFQNSKHTIFSHLRPETSSTIHIHSSNTTTPNKGFFYPAAQRHCCVSNDRQSWLNCLILPNNFPFHIAYKPTPLSTPLLIIACSFHPSPHSTILLPYPTY